MNSLYSLYYQAYVDKTHTWQVTAILRSYEHVAFDRTLDTETGLIEFFVAPAYETVFLEVMHHFEQKGLVSNLVKLPNRFASI